MIDSNFVGLMLFNKDKKHFDKSFSYIFIEEGFIMGIHGENPPLMKTIKKLLLKKQDYYGKNCLMKVGKKHTQDGKNFYFIYFLFKTLIFLSKT